MLPFSQNLLPCPENIDGAIFVVLKTIKKYLKGTPTVRHGLVSSQNEATASKKPFKCLLGLGDTIGIPRKAVFPRVLTIINEPVTDFENLNNFENPSRMVTCTSNAPQ